MAQGRKCLLIVDDTEIDRIILKSILSNDFEILEAKNGNIAFEYITTRGEQLDGILLDIAMPHIDGFDVLRFMKDKELTDIPVFLVTAEPTLDNVKKAMEYPVVVEFIGKPFDREDILRRLRSRLGMNPKYDVSNDDLKKTRAYIAELEMLYKRYLTNFGKDDSRYKVMEDLMRILLNNYNKNLREDRLPAEAVELICKSVYFCDIGEIFLPDRNYQLMMGDTKLEEGKQSHATLGASFIRLNCAKSCEYFVEICSNMCLHHHERYDGEGYPSRLVGDNNSIYNQMCRLVDEFEQMHTKFYGDKVKPIKFVVKRLSEPNGMVSPKVASLLEDCEPLIADYFMKKGV